MKQHITPEQLEELTPEGKEKLRAWWKPQEGDLYVHIDQIETVCRQCSYENNSITEEYIKRHVLLLSIGQMIEYLDEHNEFFALEKLTVFSFVLNDGENGGIVNKEPCDALWEAVKAVLNK